MAPCSSRTTIGKTRNAARSKALPSDPGDDREAAIIASLPPAAYTAVLTGKNQTTGIGLLEIYDLDQPVDSQLANISTRGFVGGQNNVMIGGFILGGNPPPAGNTRVADPRPWTIAESVRPEQSAGRSHARAARRQWRHLDRKR